MSGWFPAAVVLLVCRVRPISHLDPEQPDLGPGHVEVVITNSADCGNRGKGYVATKTFVMTKGYPVRVEAPNGESICWRKDRNPNNPVPGDWSGWSRIPLAPGQTAETDL
jgi:hypothetical protein